MAVRKIILFATLFLTACAPVVTPALTPASPATDADSGAQDESQATTPSPSQEIIGSTSQPAATNVRVEDDEEYFVPRMLAFDAIKPVYDPVFANATEAPLSDDELVMGVAIDGEAKAYPVTVLRFREIVDDELAGWPILVTW